MALDLLKQKLSFKDKVLLEQVRALEESSTLKHDGDSMDLHCPEGVAIEVKLLARSRSFASVFASSLNFERAAFFSGRLIFLFVVIAIVCGGLAVSQVLDSQNERINIYWLMLLLLGFNLFSILLWCISLLPYLSQTSGGKGETLFASLWRYFEKGFVSQMDEQGMIDRVWLEARHQGACGRWWFGKLAHGLWFTYLASGLLVLLLLLMTRQYDFVWGTSLLTAESFQKFTQVLSVPVGVFGFSTPNIEQVLSSQLGILQEQSELVRYTWAQFLIGCILVYGLLPRALLFIVAWGMSRVAEQKYSVDFSLPYYMRLQRLLNPVATKGYVVDKDNTVHLKEINQGDSYADLPDDAHWLAIELANDDPWPPAGVNSDYILGHIKGTDSLSAVLSGIKQMKTENLNIAVSMVRAPDRGIKRILTQVLDGSLKKSAKVFLVLLKRNDISSERIDDWVRVAHEFDLDVAILEHEAS